jgi:hypothetical protein
VITSLNNMLRVLGPEGILYLAIPDKRYTFDKNRSSTDFAHLLRDFKEGPSVSREMHYRDWAVNVDKHENEEDIERRATELMNMGYSIHFHVWTQLEILEMLAAYKVISKYNFEVITVAANQNEVIIILARREMRK